MLTIEAALLAAGATALAGLIGTFVVAALGARSAAAASVLAPVLILLSVAAGVAAAAGAMLLDPVQVQTMAVVLVVSTTIAATFGYLQARRIRAMVADHEREAAEQERIAQVEADRRELIAWVSHDLRTPLARVRALTEAMEDGIGEQAEHLQRLHGEVDSMATMIDDLLALSRLTGSATSSRPESSVDVTDLLSDALAGWRLSAERAGIELVGQADPGLVVQADPHDLMRAVNNLVENALRHTPADGTVTISGHKLTGSIQISVTDQCGGIPTADLPHIFETGWRGSTARTPHGGARAGLGLAIVRGVAEQAGGSAEVHNTEHGCQFRIQLPNALMTAPASTRQRKVTGGTPEEDRLAAGAEGTSS